MKTLVSEVESLGADEVVPLRNVTGPILAKVIDFCKHQLPEGTAKTSPDFLKGEDEGDVDADDDEGEFDVDSNKPKDKKLDKMSEFEAEFVNVEQPVLFDIMLVSGAPPCPEPPQVQWLSDHSSTWRVGAACMTAPKKLLLWR